MTMWRGILSILFVAVIVIPTGTNAATPEQCQAVARIAPGTPCDASTPYSAVESVLGITNNVADAKQYIKSIARDLRGSCAPVSTASNIDNLNNTFAVCSANFFKAYEATYGKGSVIVVSAFRDGRAGTAPDGSGRSANQCAGGVAESNHTRGVAMDVNPGPGGDYDTLYDFARNNPQFGVCFPRPPYRGRVDLPHMVLAGIGGSEGERCARQGVSRACSGAPAFTGAQANTSPLAPGNVANTLRQLLGQQPPTNPYENPFTQTPTTPTLPTPSVTGPTSSGAPSTGSSQPPVTTSAPIVSTTNTAGTMQPPIISGGTTLEDSDEDKPETQEPPFDPVAELLRIINGTTTATTTATTTPGTALARAAAGIPASSDVATLGTHALQDVFVREQGNTIVVGGRDLETNSEVRGFFSDNTVGTGSTFGENSMPDSFFARSCQDPSWAHSSISGFILLSLFEQLCAWRGYDYAAPMYE